jgi:hypothetical protein
MPSPPVRSKNVAALLSLRLVKLARIRTKEVDFQQFFGFPIFDDPDRLRTRRSDRPSTLTSLCEIRDEAARAHFRGAVSSSIRACCTTALPAVILGAAMMDMTSPAQIELRLKGVREL